jgi:hypothetical protein
LVMNCFESVLWKSKELLELWEQVSKKKKNPVHEKRQGWEPIHKKHSWYPLFRWDHVKAHLAMGQEPLFLVETDLHSKILYVMGFEFLVAMLKFSSYPSVTQSGSS